jgi:predicted esterase
MRKMTLGLIAACLFPFASSGAELYVDFPNEIRAGERYVIFSHGLIAEGNDPRPMHPTRGVYDLPAIRDALFMNGNFNLISHQREKNTEMKPYIDKLESWVRGLMEAGVPASRITLVGFSRGGHLTAYTSGRLAQVGINTAIMGACRNGEIPREPPLELGGHVLSIYETTDEVGSCIKLSERGQLKSFKEVAITTGKGHAAFFVPRGEWINPLRQWIDATNK